MVPNTGTNGQLGAIIGTQTNMIMKVNNQKDYFQTRLQLHRGHHQGFDFVVIKASTLSWSFIKAMTLLWSSSRLWLCCGHHQGYDFVVIIIKALHSSGSSSRLRLRRDRHQGFYFVVAIALPNVIIMQAGPYVQGLPVMAPPCKWLNIPMTSRESEITESANRTT